MRQRLHPRNTPFLRWAGLVAVMCTVSCITVDDQRDVVEDVPTGQVDTSWGQPDGILGTGGPCDAAADCLTWVAAHPCLTAFCQDQTCVAIAKINGAPCSDADPKTRGDFCANGECQSGTNICLCNIDKDCQPFDDDNPCNGQMRCDLCSCQLVIPPLGTECDDRNPLTWNDQCRMGGTCTGVSD